MTGFLTVENSWIVKESPLEIESFYSHVLITVISIYVKWKCRRRVGKHSWISLNLIMWWTGTMTRSISADKQNQRLYTLTSLDMPNLSEILARREKSYIRKRNINRSSSSLWNNVNNARNVKEKNVVRLLGIVKVHS